MAVMLTRTCVSRSRAKDLGFKAKDLSFKAKAKDLSFKAKAKDLSFKAQVLGQGQNFVQRWIL